MIDDRDWWRHSPEHVALARAYATLRIAARRTLTPLVDHLNRIATRMGVGGSNP